MRVRAVLLVALLLSIRASLASAAGPAPIRHDGRSYVDLARLCATVPAVLEASASSTRAQVRARGHVVTLTRNWAQILVDGKPVVLDAPVKVRQGAWIVPESFVTRVVPRLAAASEVAHRAEPLPRPETAPSPAVALEDLRVRSYPAFTRLVVETSAPVAFRVERTGSRDVTIRLAGLAGQPRAESVRDGLVEEVRLERAGADGLLRVALGGAPVETRTSTLADPPRLVVEIRRPDEEATPSRTEVAAPLRTIVLDAGHGGHDSGALGPTNLMEKELVLDVTKRAATLAEARLGVKVLLSRTDDYFVPLRERTSFANRERADLFVSIHANAHPQAESEGVETFFLSSEATDGAARRVAAAENSVVQLEKPARGGGRVDAVRAILWDLAQSAYQIESSRLAEVIQDSMTQSLRIPNRGVKQAGFYVLGGAAMPAVLIEIGFVTNPREERRLKTEAYRDDIARAIVAGLAEYKRQWDRRMRVTAQRVP